MASHHSSTPKEQCLEAAVTALGGLRQRQGYELPEFWYQRAWTQSASSSRRWRIEDPETTFGRIMGDIRRTVRLQREPDESEAGRWDTGQVRFPDLTVRIDPKEPYVVIDAKFDRANGTRDTWGKKKGKFSGQDQRTDYNEINQQQSGKPNQNLCLDADVCECPEEVEPEYEHLPVEDPSTVPMLLPTPLPFPAPQGIPAWAW